MSARAATADLLRADSETQLEDLIARLRERGCRLTPQRMAVLKVLISNREHLSAEQIHDRVKADFPMTSLATVYKTVAVLKEMGEILELGFGDGINRYDGVGLGPHPHVVCTNCRSIVDMDVDVAGLSGIPQEVAHKTGYTIENYRLDFFGTCPQCQEQKQG